MAVADNVFDDPDDFGRADMLVPTHTMIRYRVKRSRNTALKVLGRMKGVMIRILPSDKFNGVMICGHDAMEFCGAGRAGNNIDNGYGYIETIFTRCILIQAMFTIDNDIVFVQFHSRESTCGVLIITRKDALSAI